jgi:ankyrin repeat protein
MYAIVKNHNYAVQLLLAAGADVHARDQVSLKSRFLRLQCNACQVTR